MTQRSEQTDELITPTEERFPQCYAYTTPEIRRHDGWLKIGYTTKKNAEDRIKEQTHTADVEAQLQWALPAQYDTNPRDFFKDYDFHRYLEKLQYQRQKDKNTEWFHIEPRDAKELYNNFRENHGRINSSDLDTPPQSYILRKEQEDAVTKTLAYFHQHTHDEHSEFLWNAKPRFGKTLTAYELCQRLEAKNILVVTNRPAIANSWYEDYQKFLGTDSGYMFVSHVDGIKKKPLVHSREQYREELKRNPSTTICGCIEFVSLQDLKGSINLGGQYNKLPELNARNYWDMLIIDEAHEGIDTYRTDTAFTHIDRKWTLHLSGTPFKALASGKFSDDAIYNWTYADEQQAKRTWDTTQDEENPYEELPQLTLLTYKMSDAIENTVHHGITLNDDTTVNYTFDLSEFFKTNGHGTFLHDTEVNDFLDALTRKEGFPFSTKELRSKLKHTFWILNSVDSVKALAKKLKEHPLFREYTIIIAAGDGKTLDTDENPQDTDIKKSFDKVINAIRTQHQDKTITLSVGQLTTGVTIPEWTAVLMLANMKSPSLYMQAAFRAQNPWTYVDENGHVQQKTNAYVFDFDPARTLTLFEQFANDLTSYPTSSQLTSEQRTENVRELLNYFPVYSCDEQGRMMELDAEKVLTIPRHLHAQDVVNHGFMSNFLFANIGGIFQAPQVVMDIITNMTPADSLKNTVDITHPRNGLHLNEHNQIDVPHDIIIGQSKEIFGSRIYDTVTTTITTAPATTNMTSRDLSSEKAPQTIASRFAKEIAKTLINEYKNKNGELDKTTQKKITQHAEQSIRDKITPLCSDYRIKQKQLTTQNNDSISNAQAENQSLTTIEHLKKKAEQEKEQLKYNLIQKLQQTVMDCSSALIDQTTCDIETVKEEKQKNSIEDTVRDHLRGFARTIPAFLMAYGTEDTTLATFDTLVPPQVFSEVTRNPTTGKGVTLEEFRFLRDGGDYYDTDSQGNEIHDEKHRHHFDGHLFDPIVFDDAVQEFMRKKKELANYFDGTHEEDIFSYIPPQQTNQIFTPRTVVITMVNQLEEENPGCFDDPNRTFCDLYMKSGMYITEIVKRLYQSPIIQKQYPDPDQRLHHIFSHQVYGCAPTEIIYRICRQYILGFSNTIHIDTDHIILFDTLPAAKKGTLNEELQQRFPNLIEN